MMEKTTTGKREPVREVFEIPAGRCRDWSVPQSRVVCVHRDEDFEFCLLDNAKLENTDDDPDPMKGIWTCRRTDGMCPYGTRPIRLTMEASDGRT